MSKQLDLMEISIDDHDSHRKIDDMDFDPFLNKTLITQIFEMFQYEKASYRSKRRGFTPRI